MRNRTKGAIVALVAVTAMLAIPSAQSLPGGIAGVQQAGCNCHGAVPSDSVVPSLEGLPESYNYSETYDITVSFEGGPSQEGNVNQGGFHLWASKGSLAVTDATAQLYNENEVGHTEAGNDQVSWTLTWTAPATDTNVDFILHVNSVNGNADGAGGGTSGDMWNKLAITLGGPVEVLDEADPFVVLGVLIIVTATLLAFTLVFVFYRKDPEAFDWDNFAPWLADWLTTTDHKKIGTLYFIAGLFFLGVGGIMAMIIRIQLAVPGNDFLTQEQYNQFFTLHGTTMIFLAAMPMINGFANWMIPLQLLSLIHI